MKRFFQTILLLSLMGTQVCMAQTVNPHIQAAEDYMQAGQWDYASYEWRAALKQNPDNATVYEGLARSLLKAGLLTEAINVLTSVPKGVRNVELLLLLADAQQQEGITSKAMKAYLEILKKMPGHPVAYERLKALRQKLPSHDRQVLDRTLADIIQQARAQGDSFFAKKRYREAAEAYRLVLSHTQKVKDANNYGLSLLLAGKKQEAAKTFAMITPSTKDWRFLSNAALAELAMGRPYQARMLVQKAIALCGSNEGKAYLYNHLGYIYEVSKKYTQARFTYEKAIELKHDYRKARMNQAYIFRKDGAYNQALRVYKDLLKQEPGNAELWNQVGYAHEMQHDYSAAMKAYEKAVALDPKNKEAHFNQAMLYKKTGRKEKATASMRQVMEIEFQEAEKAGGKLQALNSNNLTDYVEIFPAGEGQAMQKTVSAPAPVKHVSQR